MRPRLDAPGWSRGRMSGLACCLTAAWVALAGCDGGESRASSDSGARVRAVLGELGQSPGQFTYPRCLDMEPGGGALWVCDKTGRLQRIDPATGAASVVLRMPKVEAGKPTGLTVAPALDGTPEPWIYIADTHEHRVLVVRARAPKDGPAISLEGAFPEIVMEFGTYGHGPGQLVYPTDVAVVTGEGGVTRFYVSEYGGNDRISVWESRGAATPKFVTAWGEFGVVTAGDDTGGKVVFSRPQSIAVDPQAGEMFVADACNHRIVVLGLDGSLRRILGVQGRAEDDGPGPARLMYPYGVALGGDGTILISEFGNGRIQRLDAQTGASRAVVGRMGRAPGEFAAPWAVVKLGDERAAVLDSGNSRVQVVDVPSESRRVAQTRAEQGAGVAR
jgi:DNA-binding beta-propeller fold protein YncE